MRETSDMLIVRVANISAVVASTCIAGRYC